jgi:hypothetical protein
VLHRSFGSSIPLTTPMRRRPSKRDLPYRRVVRKTPLNRQVDRKLRIKPTLLRARIGIPNLKLLLESGNASRMLSLRQRRLRSKRESERRKAVAITDHQFRE